MAMTSSNWLEISLVVDGEMAESVAEVLARYIPNGVVIESTAVDTRQADSAGHAVGPLRVAGYIPIDEQLEDTRQSLEKALWYLSRIRPLPQPEFKPVQHTNWAEAWKEHFHPIPIGDQLLITPAWIEPQLEGRVPICIDPGMAFGTGTHPTTQLCLELIENITTKEEIHHLIDVGCGSGILSIAALKLGAQHALGVDIEAEAIGAAQKNAELNHVMDRFEIGQGSLDGILAGSYSIQSAPLVLANILAPIILRLFEGGLGNLVTPGGTLILSGILEEQAPEMETALGEYGFELIERRMIDDWVALLARHRQ